MKNFFVKYKWLLLVCFVFSLFFMYPYLISNKLNLEHDTFFHLSRIEGYARSLLDGQLLPRIYPYKNAGAGYGSPLFYCDILLFVPAVLYNLGLSLSGSYKFLLFLCSFFSAWTMAICAQKISKSSKVAILAAFLYLFSTYRITDVYVRGAIGEVMAFIFLPLVIQGIWSLLHEEKNSLALLTFSFSGLILTHNIAFLLGCFLFAGYLLVYYKTILTQRHKLMIILKAVGLVLALTAFFTLPMLEQMMDHTMIVHYYHSSSNLANTALTAWQFFINKLIFGFAGNTGSPESLMVTNTGWFLTFVPLALFFVTNKEKTQSRKFIMTTMGLGYFFLFLCSGTIPWNALGFLGVIQFPWRFMIIATALLSIPAACALFDLFGHHRQILALSLGLCIVNSIWLLQPVFSRTFTITNQTAYTDILDGTVIDPYYSASYMRVELAGGDYLPWPSIDYREYENLCILSMERTSLTCDIQRFSTNTLFNLPHDDIQVLVPLTWYKGYQVYGRDIYGNKTPLSTYLNPDTGLVSFRTDAQFDNYLVAYDGTTIQTLSLLFSSITLIALIFRKNIIIAFEFIIEKKNQMQIKKGQ